MRKKIRKEKREEGKQIYNGLNLPQFRVGVGQCCCYVKGLKKTAQGRKCLGRLEACFSADEARNNEKMIER